MSSSKIGNIFRIVEYYFIVWKPEQYIVNAAKYREMTRWVDAGSKAGPNRSRCYAKSAPKPYFEPIRSKRGNRSLSHRKLTDFFLREEHSPYWDLLMHTEIRWKSQAKCSEKFFTLWSPASEGAGCSECRDTLSETWPSWQISPHNLNRLNVQLARTRPKRLIPTRTQTHSDNEPDLFTGGPSSDRPDLTRLPTCKESRFGRRRQCGTAGKELGL